MWTILWYGGLALVGLIVVFGSFFTVQQQSIAIVERLGKFVRMSKPGLNIKIPLIEHVVRRVSLKVQQLIVEVETKTKDDVFVKVFVAVQYRVIEEHAADSHYKLQSHVEQIKSFVLDVVRAQVPAMPLDEVFVKKDDVGKAVKKELDEAMKMYGFEIPNALVTDVDPAANVKAAMNEIQTQTRLQEAAKAKGEANKILVVKEAEANKESKKLQGEGVAAQRKAIIDGLRESVDMFKAGTGVTPGEALRLVLVTQYFDMMRDVGVSAGSKVILTPHSPAAVGDIADQLRTAILTGNEATDHHPDNNPSGARSSAKNGGVSTARS
ncbi:MAG: SPFH domain-containing protein [bacterium]|nr:SPFH domain-containing protein [bacterium]